jgi:hypothetical protein
VNYWTERSVVLRLNESGKTALAGVVEGEDVEVFVQWADELGLWILQKPQGGAEVSVALIRWSHFETALMDVVLSAPEPPNVIGFGNWQAGKRS